MRIHQPPYPRPVPDIDFDEIETFPDTIVYAGLNNTEINNNGETVEIRAAKRRRIENAALAYMRGQEINIISAKLRGPLDPTWQNPWSRNRLPSSRQTGSALRQTPTRLNSSTTREPSRTSRGIDAMGSLRRREVELNQLPAKSSTVKRESTGRRDSDQKVEAWLHRSTLAQKVPVETSSQPLSSPTPSRPKVVREVSEKQASPPRQSTPSHLISPSVSLSALKSVNQRGRVRNAPLLSHSKLQDVLEHKPVRNAESWQKQDLVSSDIEEPHSQARAEAAIRKMKTNEDHSESKKQVVENVNLPSEILNKPEQTAAEDITDNAFSQMTPENSQSSHDEACDTITRRSHSAGKTAKEDLVSPVAKQPNFSGHFDHVPHEGSTHSEQQTGVADGKFTAPVKTKDRQNETQTVLGQMLPPTTVHSQPSTADLLPSAQRQPDVAVSHSRMFEEVKPIDVITSHVESNQGSVPTRVDAAVGQNTDAQSSKVEIQGSSRLHDVVKDDETPRPLSKKQQTIETSNASNSVISRSKSTSKTKKKQASFAADVEQWPSHGSIKNALKVGKSMTGTESKSQKRKMLDIQEPDENAMSQGSPPRKRTMDHSFLDEPTASRPAKSILKNSNTSSSSHPSHQRGPSSIFLQNEQEQRQAAQDGQNGAGADKEQFDLDGAIDDLGSFLSTWDAEKDASQMLVN